MRTQIAAANWKMNSSISHTSDFLRSFSTSSNSNVIFFPPFPLLHLFAKTKFLFGAQDCSQHSQGAFTGEVSAALISDIGAKYVILGHSERRLYHNEDNKILFNKLSKAHESGLIPVFCFGESSSDRSSNNYFEKIVYQLEPFIEFLKLYNFPNAILAYEPVWAIGTGLTALPAQAQEVHFFVRKLVSRNNLVYAENLHILYGGSVRAINAGSFFQCPDVDGVLVGGASLDPNELIDIINA
jgi:triosephosphate isomerase